jgi:hypothetical protein
MKGNLCDLCEERIAKEKCEVCLKDFCEECYDDVFSDLTSHDVCEDCASNILDEYFKTNKLGV